jgi:hypothetical protein
MEEKICGSILLAKNKIDLSNSFYGSYSLSSKNSVFVGERETYF